MKTNYWMVLGTMLAASAVAQVNTNSLPAIPAPAAPAVAPAPAAVAPPAAAPVKKAKAAVKKRVVKKISEPTMNLVPGPATVDAKNLIMRGQAGLKGEVLGHLPSGETVTVISQINLDKHAADEPAQWAKIALPAEVKVWISSHFVDGTTKTVTARRLNLRGGPGENYSVVGMVERGTHVSELATKGGWIQIAPPANSFAYVAAMYLKQGAQPMEPATSAPAVVQTTPPPAPVVPATPTFIPASPAMAVPPPAVPAPVAPAPAIVAATVPPPPVVPSTPAMPAMVQMPVDTNPPPPRVATHEGIVRRSVSIVAPTAYELYDPATDKQINYLNSTTTNLDLSRYDGAQIIVTGEEGLAARWGATPVLTVQRIYVVNASPALPYQRLQSPRASKQTISGSLPYKPKAN